MYKKLMFEDNFFGDFFRRGPGSCPASVQAKTTWHQDQTQNRPYDGNNLFFS